MRIKLSEYLTPTSAKRGYIEDKQTGHIDPDDIGPCEHVAPRVYDDEALIALGEDIKARGQLQPIRVYWSTQAGKWLIVFGERRWRAIQAVGITRVYASFMDREPTTAEVLAARLVDDLHRVEKMPIEQARSFEAIMNLNDWSIRDLADHLHVSPGTITKSVALLSLPEPAQGFIESGAILPSVAYQISRVDDEEKQTQLIDLAIAGNLSRDTAAEHAAEAIAKQPKASRKRQPNKSNGNRRIIKTSAGVTITLSHRRRLTDQDVTNALREALNLADRNQQGVA